MLMGKKPILGCLVAILAVTTVGSLKALAQDATYITAFRNQSLTNHNTNRTKHRSPNLAANSTLDQGAQDWAKYLADSGKFEHSTSTQRNGAGENLYVYYTTGTIGATALADKGVSSWYNEVTKYNYSQPGFSPETGHFTQLVWKSSTGLGCGVAQGKKVINSTNFNAYYVVCRYSPAGNVQGQFPQNVLQP
ncbi:CAP family protein [Symplocastrum sp. BBK-W-15]|uniref:CAP family protein n=2 Tax=Limnofasciculus TaxID=3064905 RepID=A0AAE3KQG2_9CYAN|nr:CAP family protein [Limnofasciculus baicalensis BBK-W-15]